LQRGVMPGSARTAVEVGQGGGTDVVILEATLGDMMTME
jgi:hypothetical protein